MTSPRADIERNMALLFTLLLSTASASVLRVETGHQNIEIDGRDPYLGYFTRVHFNAATCVQSLTVHCLTPLTGAEEIDLLFSECPRGHWRVAHYTNTKEVFRLKQPLMARQMSISSRQPLTIIDVQVASCANTTYDRPVSCSSSGDHPRRHGRVGPMRASEYGSRRRKRAAPTTTPLEYDSGSLTEILDELLVPKGETLTIREGATLRFADGIGMTVYGSLIVKGSKRYPVRLEPLQTKWRGVQIIDGSPQSSIRFLNITGSELGLFIRGGPAPTIENVFADSNDQGIRIETNSSDIRLVRSYAVNSLGAGFHFIGKASFVMESCVAAGNRGNGIHAQGLQELKLTKTNAYTNSQAGLYATSVRSITLEDTVIDGNGAGIRISKQKTEKLNVQISNSNISTHHYGPGLLIRDGNNTSLSVRRSQFHDNYMGGISMEGELANGKMIVAESNFTRNRGSTISISLLKSGKVELEENIFHANQLNDYREGEAVVAISTSAETKTDASIRLFHNQFTKNIMNDVIEIRRLTGTTVNTLITKCELLSNLARSIIHFKGMTATVAENMFHNTQASCEISTPLPSHYDSARNFWGYDRQREILSRICATNDSTADAVAYNLDDNEATMRTVTRNPLPPLNNTYNLVKAVGTPYTIDSDVVISSDETVIVEPGTEFIFGPGVGLNIHEKGKLLLNGTSSDPIMMGAVDGGGWRGIVVKPGGSLSLSYTTIADAAIGLWIDSDRVHLDNARIERPVVHGVEITTNSGREVDLGDTVIIDGMGTAIAVDERKGNLTIKNAVIENAATGGIDFVSPSDYIELENLKILGSGSHSIHISEYPTMPLLGVVVRNVTITDQLRGQAGLLIAGGWTTSVLVDQLTAERNAVPSIVIALECNSKPSKTRILNSTFKENRENVVSIQLGECGSFELSGNSFEGNNKDGRAGVLRIDAMPKKDGTNQSVDVKSNVFRDNGGDFVAFLSSDGETKSNGTFQGNTLRDNRNSGATVIVTSPSYSLKGNIFENPSSAYELESRGDGSWILDASSNQWGTESLDYVLRKVKASDGSVRLQPLLSPTTSATTTMMTSLATPPRDSFAKCSHVNHCSYRGTCLEGLCVCPFGFVGADCSVVVGCKDNCSSNGICNVFNVCHCHEGWTSPDCSIPMCSFDCGGHGDCVSKDECRCHEKWTGAFCLEPACSKETCHHGRCSNKKCVCEDHWSGKGCNVPLCTNCSLNGQCISPNECKCFDDYGGQDCSHCIGDSCNACDLDCDHGTCEMTTRTCTCASGWSGAACDVCGSGACSSKGRVLYILPSTVEMDSNTVVTVFGSELARTTDGRYSCIFGTSSTIGQRESSSVIRCPVPANVTTGRHLFNIASNGDIIPTIDGRTLHFTFYQPCLPSFCGGSCIGPLCMCPRGRTGNMCDVIELVPEIDHRFLSNQMANKGQEGTPYVVYLPTMPGTVLRVNSSIASLHFDPIRGLLEWAEPIGKDTPYDITVIADSMAGSSSLSWNLTIPPSYSAIVDDVTTQGNRLVMEGRIHGIEKPSRLPVNVRLIRTKRTGEENDSEDSEEFTVTSDEKGRFTYGFIPKTDGRYTITASHPGQRADSSTGKSINVETQRLNIEQPTPTRFVVKDAKNCSANLLGDTKGKVDVSEESSNFVIEFSIEGELHENTYVSITCDGEKEIHRIPSKTTETVKISTTPTSLFLQQNSTSMRSKLIELTIHAGGISFHSPLSIRCSDDTQSIWIVASEPPLEHYEEYSRGVLKLAVQLDVSKVKTETLILVHEGQELLHIPYVVSDSPASFAGDSFLQEICLQDEWLRAGSNPRAIASLSLTNLQHKKDATQNNVVVNGKPVSFWIPEGIYSVTAISPSHQQLNQLLWLSAHNSSFCLRMTSLSPMVAAIKEGKWTEANIEKQTPLPYLEFSPSTIDGDTDYVLVTARGPTQGIIVPKNIERNEVNMISSVQSVTVNESFWLRRDGQLRISSDKMYEDCVARPIGVPFAFFPEGSNDILESSSNILLDYRNNSTEMCDEESKPIPFASVTKVLCDCGQGARAKCRRMYRSATACGSAWSRIADDTVSLQSLSTFLLLVSDCRNVGVSFNELDKSMQCISSLESECPITMRKKRENEDYGNENDTHSDVDMVMMNDGPASIINHLAAINGRVNLWMRPQMTNLLNALDMQSIGVAGLYQEFFQRIRTVFPPELFDNLSRDTVDKLIEAIGDNSEGGTAISEDEAKNIGDTSIGTLWNDTVSTWNGGKWSPHEEKGIRYADVKQLVTAADRLKSFTRQNGGTDPFAVLHEYLGRLLAASGSPSEECATATVLIEPLQMHEGDSIHVKVLVTNTQSFPLSSPSLSYDVIRDSVLSPSASLISNGIGINTMTPDGQLQPVDSFEAKWSRKLVLSKKLTASAKYQAIIVLSFSVNGKPTKQRLHSQPIEVHPVRSIKVVYFLQPNISSDQPFNAMASIMNIGYSSLSSVAVEGTEMAVHGKNGQPAGFRLDGISIDGQRIGSTLSYAVGPIASGNSKTITYNISTSDPQSSISSFRLSLSAEGTVVPVEDGDKYVVRAMAGQNGKNGLMVSLPESELPMFFFRPETGTIVNIVPLQFVNSQSQDAVDPERKIILSSFVNSESRSFTGFMWGRMKMPQLPEGFELIKFTLKGEMTSSQKGRDRELRPIVWTEGHGEDSVLHFIDSGSPAQHQMLYEMVFADPAHYSVPSFDQNSYRIQLMPEAWPMTSSPIGQVSAGSRHDNPLQYSLYSPDGAKTFSVDKDTGTIFLEHPVLPGQELCLVLSAEDAEGQRTDVPLAVNTGGARGECVLFNTEGLTPSIHNGPWTVRPTTGDTSFTGRYTTEALPTPPPLTEGNTGETTTELPTTTEQITTSTEETIHTVTPDTSPETPLPTTEEIPSPGTVPQEMSTTEGLPTPDSFTPDVSDATSQGSTEGLPTPEPFTDPVIIVPTDGSVTIRSTTEDLPTPADFTTTEPPIHSVTPDSSPDTPEPTTEGIPTHSVTPDTSPETPEPTTEEVPTPNPFSPTISTIETTEQIPTTTEITETTEIVTTSPDATLATEATTIGTITADSQWTDYTKWDSTSTTSEVPSTTTEEEHTTEEMPTPGELTTEPPTTTEIIYTMSSEASPSTVDRDDWTTSTAEFTVTVTDSTSTGTSEFTATVTDTTGTGTSEFTATVSETTHFVSEDPMLRTSTTLAPPIIVPTDGSHQTMTSSSDQVTSSRSPPYPESSSSFSASATLPTRETSRKPLHPILVDACSKKSIPVWNLICELNKTVASKGNG